ncbi:hypothetical protein Esti_004292 [Eimeria stiedai]
MYRNLYDTDCITWSPQGRVFQVEYAKQAVTQGTCCVGLRSHTHVALCTLKKSTSKLAGHQQKLFCVDDHAGVAISGITADAKVLCEIMRNACLQHKFTFDSEKPAARLALLVADKCQHNTQRSGKRPYGVGLLLAACDRSGPRLFETCPSGNYYEHNAIAFGARSQASKTYLERHFESFGDANIEDLLLHGVKALKASLSADIELTSDSLCAAIVGQGQPWKELKQEELQTLIDRAASAEAGTEETAMAVEMPEVYGLGFRVCGGEVERVSKVKGLKLMLHNDALLSEAKDLDLFSFYPWRFYRYSLASGSAAEVAFHDTYYCVSSHFHLAYVGWQLENGVANPMAGPLSPSAIRSRAFSANSRKASFPRIDQTYTNCIFGGKEKDEASDSRHSMFKRQAAEVKAVKHEIALLKQRRRKLRKKFVAEVREKREINKKIKALLKGLHEKHQREESAPQGEPQPNTNQTTAAAIEVDHSSSAAAAFGGAAATAAAPPTAVTAAALLVAAAAVVAVEAAANVGAAVEAAAAALAGATAAAGMRQLSRQHTAQQQQQQKRASSVAAA